MSHPALSRRAALASLLIPRALGQSPGVPDSVLVHEHVLVDFIGADRIAPGRYDPQEVFRAALPKLQEVRALGCVRLLECTPNFLGRDPQLLRRLSEASGIDLWTNTGLYAAVDHKYLPAFAKTESAAQLARRWEREARAGIAGVKPRFIKIGVNKGPLHEWDRKIVQAAALTSRETGLTIAAHTGDGAAALEELDIIVKAQCPPQRFVWVHAQNEGDLRIHAQVARAGAWVEFDAIRKNTVADHVRWVRTLAEQNLLDQVLVSQDSGWWHVGEPGGGKFRGYTDIYTDFVPQLPPGWPRRLLADNPRRAFGN